MKDNIDVKPLSRNGESGGLLYIIAYIPNDVAFDNITMTTKSMSSFGSGANGQNGTDPWEDYSPSQMSMRHYVVSEPVLINFGELPFVSHILPLTARINDFIKERSSTMNPQLLNILIILLIITLSIPFVLIIVGIVIAVVFNIKERKASLKRKATVTRLKEELTKKGNE